MPVKLDLPDCPHCTSSHTVRTETIAMRGYYFCLACGKSFETAVKPVPPPADVEPS